MLERYVVCTKTCFFLGVGWSAKVIKLGTHCFVSEKCVGQRCRAVSVLHYTRVIPISVT